MKNNEKTINNYDSTSSRVHINKLYYGYNSRSRTFELCEKYPTHIDCIDDDPVDPLLCEVGYVNNNGTCVIDEDPDLNFLDIYYMNDFHGAILEDDPNMGLSKIGNYIKHYTDTYPNNSIVLAGGDMLQGSALSNYYQGLSTIDLMDEIGFDAFTLGNHEFDWGLDVVTQYFDEDETNGEADFPLLGANVFLKGTTTIPDYIDPYTIIEKGDIKIGVIGTMGYGLEYSIAQSKIDAYEFAYPVPIIEEYAIHLRTVEECDIVLWVGHDGGSINDELIALSGDASLDALFNAHTHNDYADDSERIPQLQSGSTGEYVGHIRLYLNDNNAVYDFVAENSTEECRIEVTGMPSVYSQLDKSLINSQMSSLVIAIIMVLLIVGLILRSPMKGLFAAIPIIATITILFGFMGVTGIPLDIATVLVASVALGIGIDYSIHIITHFSHVHKETKDLSKAMEETIMISGKAIVINVVSVAAGFLVLIFSEMVPLQNFGLLVAMSMIGSGLGALTLLPVILILHYRRQEKINK